MLQTTPGDLALLPPASHHPSRTSCARVRPQSALNASSLCSSSGSSAAAAFFIRRRLKRVVRLLTRLAIGVPLPLPLVARGAVGEAPAASGPSSEWAAPTFCAAPVAAIARQQCKFGEGWGLLS